MTRVVQVEFSVQQPGWAEKPEQEQQVQEPEQEQRAQEWRWSGPGMGLGPMPPFAPGKLAGTIVGQRAVAGLAGSPYCSQNFPVTDNYIYKRRMPESLNIEKWKNINLGAKNGRGRGPKVTRQ